MIDTHAHLYLSNFSTDLEAVLERAKQAGVKAIFLPAIDSETHEAMLQMATRFDICRPMMGLHPCSVNADFKNEIQLVETYLEKHRFIAVGEIGLDFYWDKTYVQQQYDAFHLQVQLALRYDLPIVVHSRNAVDECIEVVAQYPGLRGVFHCFSGTAAQAQRLIDLNILLGIGGVATFKNGGLDKVLPEIGLSSLVLETDSPYLAPLPFRGKRNEPAYTKLVAERIASLLSVGAEEVMLATTRNAENLFRFRENH